MVLIVLGALADPGASLRLFSFASAAFGVGLAVMLARTARRRARVSLGAAALFVAALAGLSAYGAVLVLASRDLMIADFMNYRGIAIMVARLAVSAAVFERIAQLDDADIAALRARWRAARAALGFDEAGRRQ